MKRGVFLLTVIASVSVWPMLCAAAEDLVASIEHQSDIFTPDADALQLDKLQCPRVSAPSSKRFRIAQSRVECLQQCSIDFAKCRQPCGVDAQCNNQCDASYAACQRGC